MKKKSLFLSCIKQMRIRCWVKNLFVFSPIIFSLEMLNPEIFLKGILLTLAFCFVSSAIYVFNDIHDAESDRKHATKRNRPIASGDISVPFAWGMMVCLLIIGLVLSFLTEKLSVCFILAYVVINILYSRLLKTQAVIDCFCIAAGFVFRVLTGGTVVTGGVSSWMFLTIVALSLFMAFGKRRGELKSYGSGETRDVLNVYTLDFLDGTVFMCAGLSVFFYSLWAISQNSDLVYTVPIVILIVIRYLFLVFKGWAEADPTTLILSDKLMLCLGGLCGIIILVLLYGTQIISMF